MTQTQEEMILIGAFGLFWLCTFSYLLSRSRIQQQNALRITTAVLVALRAFGTRGDVNPMNAASGLGLSRTPAASPTAVERRTVTIDRSGFVDGSGPGRPNANANTGGAPPLQQLGHSGTVPQGWPCSGEAVRCVVEEWRYY